MIPKVSFCPQKSLVSHFSRQTVTFGVTFESLCGERRKSLAVAFESLLIFQCAGAPRRFRITNLGCCLGSLAMDSHMGFQCGSTVGGASVTHAENSAATSGDGLELRDVAPAGARWQMVLTFGGATGPDLPLKSGPPPNTSP